MNKKYEVFDWDSFLQPYELAVEGFLLKMEGIKKQYLVKGIHCPIEIVSGRVKTPESIINKAERMNVNMPEVHDIGGGIRKDIKLIEERDYVKNVKPSGYRSLHLICRYNVETIEGQQPILLEFQIRTHAMHFWASIEHSIKYKYNKKIPQEIKDRLINASVAATKLDMEMSAIHQAMLEVDKDTDTEINHGDPMEKEIILKKY